MNPQMRVFHQCAWEALEDAGYDPRAYQGAIGIYAGAYSSFYWQGLSRLSGKCEELGMFDSNYLNDSGPQKPRIPIRFVPIYREDFASLNMPALFECECVKKCGCESIWSAIELASIYVLSHKIKYLHDL